MKKKFWIAYFAFCVSIVCIAIMVSKYVSYKQTQKINEIFDNVDRSFAIRELSELRGRVLEIQHLSRWNNDKDLEEMMLQDLEDIATYNKGNDNKYLDNVQIHIPLGNIEYKTEMVIDEIDSIIYYIGR